MKYILTVAAALAVCIGAGFLVLSVVRKLNKRTVGRGKASLIIIASDMTMLITVMLIYFGIYYHAGYEAEIALKGSNLVSVETIDGGYLFDGPSNDKAIIFYPGAKVEAAAYAPLMLKLAEAGFDCFLADMPLNFALLKSDIAGEFIGAYNYDTWIMAGHSLGGAVATLFIRNNVDVIDGLILLASYPASQIDGRITLCTIYGSEDGCFNLDLYEANSVNRPGNATEYVIAGGNHAQFGDYGTQKGDGQAAITADEQQNETVNFIAECFLK